MLRKIAFIDLLFSMHNQNYDVKFGMQYVINGYVILRGSYIIFLQKLGLLPIACVLGMYTMREILKMCVCVWKRKDREYTENERI